MASGSEHQGLGERRAGGGSLWMDQDDEPAPDWGSDSEVEIVSGKQASKKGRKASSIRIHFTSTGPMDPKQKRCPCKCNYCFQEFDPGQSVTHKLQNHLLFHCRDISEPIKDQVRAGAADGKRPALPIPKATGTDPPKGMQAAPTSTTGKAASRQTGMAEFVSSSKESSLPKPLADDISRDLMLAVVTGGVPMTFFSNPYLISAFKKLRPAYKPPSE
jgi:hypothetical protein